MFNSITTPRNSRVATAIALAALGFAPVALTLATGHSAAAQVLSAEKQASAAGTYGVEAVHSEIGFVVTHLGVSKVRGHFNEFDGTVKVDPKDLKGSSVDFSIKTASVDTANPQRDTHLKSKDFFDAATYPEMTFKSSRISKRKNGYAALGKLTIHGISKDIVLPFTVTGPVKGMQNSLHLGVDTELTINRKDYGLNWSGAVEGVAMVSDDVNITISLDLAKK